MITHSTMKKKEKEWTEISNQGWVEEISLQDLLGSYAYADVLTLEMPQDNRIKALDYANQHLIKGTKYDWWMLWVAVKDQFWWLIWKDNLENVNCVELIAEWLWDEKIKEISDPNDFLKSDILKPTYMTTISS